MQHYKSGFLQNINIATGWMVVYWGWGERFFPSLNQDQFFGLHSFITSG